MKKVSLISVFMIINSLSFLTAQEFKLPGSQDINAMVGGALTELDGNTTLYFVDAEDGNPVSEAAVTLNGIEAVTDSSGKVLLTMPPDGHYKVGFRKKGYIISEFNIEVFGRSNIFTNHFAVSKSLPIGYIRITLCWGENPPDLDAHLVKKDQYHISYKNMRISDDKTVILDIDDTSSFGPETITIRKVDDNGHYSFFVHNYSKVKNKNCKKLIKSKAVVIVYGDSNKILDKIPLAFNGEGGYWHVLDIIDSQIVIINKLESSDDFIQ